MNTLLTNNEANMEVIEVAKVGKKKGYTHSGHLSAKSVSIQHRPTFSDVSAVYNCFLFCAVQLCEMYWLGLS